LGGSQYQLLTLFADGGWMMYPLVLCSLLALGVIIAKAWTLWVAHRNTKRVLTEVEEVARDGRIEEAIGIASDVPGPAAAILLSGLKHIRGMVVAEGEVEKAVNTTGAIELGFLERGLVVLATAVVPREDIGSVADQLGLDRSPDGFFQEADAKLRPVDTNVEDIFVAGCCQSPKDIPDAVGQAKAAASSALCVLVRAQARAREARSSGVRS